MSLNLEGYKSKWIWVLAGTLVGVGLTGALSYRQYRAHVAQVSEPGASCENGIGSARAHARPSARKGALPPASALAVPQTAWIPKINDSKLTEPAPAGMTWIPGGLFWMGTDDDHMADTKPWHRVYVDGYWGCATWES